MDYLLWLRILHSISDALIYGIMAFSIDCKIVTRMKRRAEFLRLSLFTTPVFRNYKPPLFSCSYCFVTRIAIFCDILFLLEVSSSVKA